MKRNVLSLLLMCGITLLLHAGDVGTSVALDSEAYRDMCEAIKYAYFNRGGTYPEQVTPEMLDQYDVGYSIEELLDHGVLPSVNRVGILDLSHMRINSLKGFNKIPDKQLSSLERLNLFDNQISSFEGMPELSNLEWLNLSNNQISSCEGMPKLKNLEWLNLGYNQMSSFEGMPELQKLERLYFRYNQISSCEGMPKLKNLILLNLGYNQMSSFEGLPELKKLERLYLVYNQISSFEGMPELEKLKEFDLVDNPIAESQAELQALRQKLHDARITA